MASTYTTNLGLTLPTTGELAGTWGSTVNTGVTSLIDSAIAGTETLSTDADVTLTTTTGAANQARMAILKCTGARTVLRNITAPAATKEYTVINATTGGFSVVIRGVGPTTGVTVLNGQKAHVAWNGTDFVQVSAAAGANSDITSLSGLTTALSVAQGGTGATTLNALAKVGANSDITGLSAIAAGTAALPSITPTGDPNTGVWFPAADTVAVSTAGVERARTNSAGNTLYGTENYPSNKSTVTPKVVINGTGVAGATQVIRNTTPGGGGAIVELSATRGTDVNSYTIVQSGDGLGSVTFSGADGNEFAVAAQITGAVDGTPGDNDMPGRLVFSTTPDGSTTPVERIRIDSSGNVGVGTAGSASQIIEASKSQDAKTQIKATNANAGANASAGVLFGTSSGDNGYVGANGGAASSAIGGANALQITNLSAAPIVLATNGTEKLRITSGGGVTVSTAAGLGYGTGAGGTVTQATSKSTTVTLNKPCGVITMNNAALAAGASVAYVFNNSLVGIYDVVNLSFGLLATGAQPYNAWISYTNNGQLNITLQNISAGSLSEAVVINFAIIKGAAA